ncbi:MAG TPA: 23S rRNA (adenine(2030)-N(6))-methyltransferase RlmJ [Albidovulum sp.]|uniref:23S rRNA (adenine(2030)-N(6))-methyltransferase RlmJ n=1 Tax=Albidovulum sp. TaxID=1872424 RepID=UPI002BFDBB7A|nr:23S rRNA (adenine(2030)-N(6))-methyltransferase RlmJ [Albidovulum sp.]
MLSYQHIYHAGNMADLHKHALLAAMLGYLTAKDKPLSYIETHAGRGLYDLGAPEALKTGEAAEGVLRLGGRLEAAHPFARVLTRIRAVHGPDAYPGSPLIAAEMLRQDDRITLAELHPREFAALEAAMAPYPARVVREDGLQLALSLTPPDPRRGLMLIDPSYEVKADYAALPPLLRKVHAKWNVGVLALWYPLLASGAERPMVAALDALGLPKVLRHELRFPPAREGHGMVGSGMFVVNAPFGLAEEAARLDGVFAARR